MTAAGVTVVSQLVANEPARYGKCRLGASEISGWRCVVARRGGIRLGLNQLLVVIALILTVLDLLRVGVGSLPLIPLAVLLLCLAWLVP